MQIVTPGGFPTPVPKNLIVIPIFRTKARHALEETVVLVYVRDVDADFEWMVPFSHPDAAVVDRTEFFRWLLSSIPTIYTSQLMDLLRGLPEFSHSALGSKMHDMSVLEMGLADETTLLMPIDIGYTIPRGYTTETMPVTSVPLERLMAVYSEYGKIVQMAAKVHRETLASPQYQVVLNECDFIDHIVTPNLVDVERNGLAIDRDEFLKHFNENAINPMMPNLVHTRYNVYTTTGRPSNAYAGVNYAALNTTDESRKSFISKYDDSILVSMDYEAFHIHLIAKLIGYVFPPKIDSIHEHFGRMYFRVAGNMTPLTDEEYASSKQKTFENLYSEGRPGTGIQFFDKVYGYIDAMWRDFKRDGDITIDIHPVWKRSLNLLSIQKPSPSKLFNYIIQKAETTIAMTALDGINKHLKEHNHQSTVVLYTYDSFLIDYTMRDGNMLLRDLISIAECDGQFPIRISYGVNYKDIKDVTHNLTLK